MEPEVIVLETARLRLREVALSDAAFLLALLNDPLWLANIGDRGVRSREDAERYIRDNIRAPYQALGYGMYAVQLKSSAQPLGICGLVKRDFLPDPDLGVALLPGWVRQGYASEAARAVLLHAGSRLGLARLYAIVRRGNHRSVRLLERLEFRHQETRSTSADAEVELYVRQLQRSA
jgi:RimJ/RimL family protein N-acetyltransferase